MVPALIVDCFLFNDEWECLEIRISELEGLVDRFLLVEGNRYFNGEPRQPTPTDALKGLSPKIEQLIVEIPRQGGSWDREWAQRNAIKDGIVDLSPKDYVLVSDVDEIPRRSAVEDSFRFLQNGMIAAFDLDQYYFRLNLRDTVESVLTTRLCRKENIQQVQNLRALRPRAFELMVPNGGWHFGWLGSPERTKQKLSRFSHQELNTPEIANEDYLATCHRLRMTAHNGHPLERVEIDDTFPLLVREHPERFAHLIEP